VLSNRLPLIRLGWIPLRLQLGIGVLRKQARLGSVNASTRGCRHALTLESSITAKRRNSCKRAELRRQAADVAAAIGVRAVLPLITALLSTFYGFTDDPAPSES